MPFCQGTDYSLVVLVTDLLYHLTYDLRGAWHTVYGLLLTNLSEMLPEIFKMEKCYFLKPIIYFQII